MCSIIFRSNNITKPARVEIDGWCRARDCNRLESRRAFETIKVRTKGHGQNQAIARSWKVATAVASQEQQRQRGRYSVGLVVLDAEEFLGGTAVGGRLRGFRTL